MKTLLNKMLNRENYRFLIGSLLITGSMVFSYVLIAQATSADDIVYPVAELSGCKSETDCRAFCDKPINIVSCVSFAEKHNLMSKEEAEIARKFSAIGNKGPGGCTGQDSCESYCDDIKNMNECLSFAEQNGLMPPEELAEAKKVQAALAQGAKLPGGCSKKESCEVYCENPDNMKECLAFAEAAGFMSPSELADAKKALIAIEKGIKPPPCRGEEDCDVYCSEPGNFEQCISFAEAAGFVSAEEAQMARKTGGKGPGGCKGRECEKFCEDEANSDVCFEFAKEHGLISEEELKNAEEGRGKIQEILNNVPPEVATCLSSTLGIEVLDKLKDGSSRPSPKIGDSIRQCFETMIRSGSGPGEHGNGMDPGSMSPGNFPSDFTGPGGCKSEAECKAFCEANPGQCGGSSQPNGGGEHREPSGDFRQNQPPTGTFPPDGFREGGMMPTPEQLQQQYQEKYNEEFQRRSQEQQQQQSDQQYQQQHEQQYQQQQQYPSVQPPSDGTAPQVPQSQSDRRSFLGSILNVLINILY